MEAFLELQQEQQPGTTPKGRADTLVAVAALWQQGCRPRAMLLGQLLASIQQVTD